MAKLASPTRGEQAFKPARVQFHVAVQDGDPGSGCGAPAEVHGIGEAPVLAATQDAATRVPRQPGSTIARAIVDHYDFRHRRCLGADGGEETLQKIRAVVDGNDGGYHLYTCDCNDTP